jgi:Xaa-Pro aminopeptidase
MIELVSSPQNIKYLSGFSGSIAMLVIDGKNKTLFVDGRYTEQAEKEAQKGIKVVQIPLNSTHLEAAVKLIKQKKARIIGFEDEKVDVSSYNKMKKELPNVEFVPISKKIRDQRCVKTRSEIELIKKSALLADVVFDCIVRMIKEGISEKDIAAELDYLMKIMGGDGPAFESIVAAGANTSIAHYKPQTYVIKKGDMVLMDFGVAFKGYNSDITRMISIGVPSQKQKDLYGVVLKAQETGIKKIKAGVPAKNIDLAARGILEKEGLAKYFSHATGHGVGLAVHEGPRVSLNSTDILKEGMVITVEPGIYIKGVGGFRVEDMVLVKKNGYEVLTRSPKNLIAI